MTTVQGLLQRRSRKVVPGRLSKHEVLCGNEELGDQFKEFGKAEATTLTSLELSRGLA